MGAAVGRGSVSLRRWFHTQNVPFEDPALGTLNSNGTLKELFKVHLARCSRSLPDPRS